MGLLRWWQSQFFVSIVQYLLPEGSSCLLLVGRAEMDVVADKERRGRVARHQAHMNPALVDVEEDIVGFTSKIDSYYLEDREFLKLFKKYFNE